MANDNPTLKLNDKHHKTAKPYSPKHAQTQMESWIVRKTGLKQSKHVAEWGKQNQQGGSKIFRNLGKVAAATIGSSLVDP